MISFDTLWFRDTESVHRVVVEVDEGVLAVVHVGNEIGELLKVGLVASVLACVGHDLA